MNTLKHVLSLPTAPFHEDAVAGYIKGLCKKLKLRVKGDKSGNLIVRYKRGRARQPVIFAAHMDHPGFEVISVKNGRCIVGILGGIKPEYFAGAQVLIKTADGIVKGRVAKRPMKKKWYGKKVFEVLVGEPLCGLPMAATEGRHYHSVVAKGDFGWYNLPSVRIKKDFIYTKSADNLVSVAAILELLSNLVRKKIVADVRCVFTRAEEVGFVGCISLAEQNILPKKVPIVVLECSSAKAAKVEIGGGPVLRVGDKRLCYSTEIDYWLKEIANNTSKKDKKFRFQRALLGGGTCEASIWKLKNKQTGGLAFPLGNYHNNGEHSYAPEYVSIKDYKWMQDMLMAIVNADKYLKIFKSASKDIIENYSLWKAKLKIRRP